MFRFIKNVSITTFILFASWVFVMAIFAPAPADAIIFSAPPRTIQTGDVTSDTILDGTITGADISSSASTTMFRLQVSDLSATSTVTSTFAGGFAIKTTGFVFDNATDRVGIGTASPTSKLHIDGQTNSGSYSANASLISLQSVNATTLSFESTFARWFTFGPNASTLGSWQIITGNSGGGNPKVFLAGNSNGNIGVGTTTPRGFLGIDDPAGIDPLVIGSTTPKFIIKDSGNVGIGTTTPGSTLSINGDIFFNGSLRFEDGSSQTVAAISADAQNFTGDGTYTKPANAKHIFVQLWAGGGGSGGVANNTGSGAGGGGSYKEYMFDAADVGATEAVTVGAAGAAGAAGANAGGAGGASSFGSLLSAAGGDGGSAGGNPNSNGGAGGAYGHDDTGTAGTGAALAGAATYGGGGGGAGGTDAGGTKTGGNSFLGGGGGGGGNMAGVAGAAGTSDLGGNGGAGGNDAVGTAGTAPSGGGGGSGSNAAGNRAGAAGAVGQVKITTFF